MNDRYYRDGMKDFSEMTLEELVETEIRLNNYIKDLREKELKEAIQKVKALLVEVNELQNEYGIYIEAETEDGVPVFVDTLSVKEEWYK